MFIGLRLRSKLARSVRKWADLIDPRREPTSGVTIEVCVDTKDAEEALAAFRTKLEVIQELSTKVIHERSEA